jgi:hypothetical protein
MRSCKYNSSGKIRRKSYPAELSVNLEKVAQTVPGEETVQNSAVQHCLRHPQPQLIYAAVLFYASFFAPAPS